MINLPEYWTLDREMNALVLSYAVRGGLKHGLMTAFGVALVLWCLYAIGWLMRGWFGPGGEVLIGGILGIILLLGVMTAGVYVLDLMLYQTTSYRLDAEKLTVEKKSIFGCQTLTISKNRIVCIFQRYQPPGQSSPAGHPGTWVTFVQHDADAKKSSELVLTGLSTPAEARWFGPLFSKWAGVELKRDFASGLEEADPSELPDLKDVH